MINGFSGNLGDAEAEAEAARPLRYYGITGNLSSLQESLEGAKEIWKRWL
jgi:hypothetical protein